MRELRAWAASYLAEHQASWSASTLSGHRVSLRYFLSFLEEGGWDLTREAVCAFMADLQGRPWSGCTLHTRLLCVRSFLRWALRRGHVIEDLSALIVSKRPAALPKTLTEADVLCLLEQGPPARHPERTRAILELLYGTGLRASELVKLHLGDVALGDQLLHVREGKGGKDRIVPFGVRVRDVLRAYLACRPARDGALFLTSTGRPIRRTALWAIVKRAAQRAGLEKRVWPHVLRHSYATHLLRHGAPLPAIQALLGHARLSSTQIYLGLDVGDLKRMIERSHPRERDKPKPKD